MKRAASRRGFTLIELLTVVLILMILTGLLLAALKAARVGARAAQCQKNLKEVGNAFQKVVTDWRGRSAGTIADVLGDTGGRWVDLAGNIDTPAMKGWDGAMGFALEFYAEEARRMWSCPETITPYVGNLEALGRQEYVVGVRTANPGVFLARPVAQMPALLGTTAISAIANPGKTLLAYDGGIGLAGIDGLAAAVTAEATDFDDGGYPGLTPTNWGYFWYAAAAGTLEGPHTRTHNVLRADGSAGILREPPNPADPTTASEIMTVPWTDPRAPSQQLREFTRFPRLFQ
jgi:prepilin-type N-terminal cleavage/methylation domain-containing protein